MRKTTAVVALSIIAAMGVAGCKKGKPPAGPTGAMKAPAAAPAPVPTPAPAPSAPTTPVAPAEGGEKPAGQ